MKQHTLALSLFAVGTTALAHGGVTHKEVLARMEVMKAIGEQMQILGSMAKGQTPFDAAAANAGLIEVAAQSARIAPMFETRAEDPKSEALPAIWQRWDDFAELAHEAETTAEALAGTVSTEADLGPALGQIGGTCKACHSRYRE